MAEVAKQGGKFIDADIEFAIGDRDGRFAFRFRGENQRGLVFVLGQMAVNAVVANIELAPYEPLPARRITGVKCGVPVPVPTQQIGVVAKALREILFAEAFVDAGIGQIGLAYKFGGRIVVFLLPPMHCDLSFGGLSCHVLHLANICHVTHPSSLNL